MSYRFILSAGGTGGHIFPAIAIADALKEKFPNAQFLFVGSNQRMEMKKVPQSGYEIKGLNSVGIDRKHLLKNILFPFKLIQTLIQAHRILKDFAPDVVIGTGGYASAATLKMAQMMDIPTLIQEQNSLAGLTNRWLSRKADCICVAYEHMEKFFPADKIHFTGNPVRKDLVKLPSPETIYYEQFGLNPNKKTLLILGGSLGAGAINALIEKHLPLFEHLDVQLIWQCGSFYYGKYQHYNRPMVRVLDFIKHIDTAYSLADMIISRSGASSISELCLVGKPVIFIPSPNVTDNHQYKNAQAIAQKGGAVVIAETELHKFYQIFTELWHDKVQKEALAKSIRALGIDDATERIVQQLISLLPKNQ